MNKIALVTKKDYLLPPEGGTGNPLMFCFHFRLPGEQSDQQSDGKKKKTPCSQERLQTKQRQREMIKQEYDHAKNKQTHQLFHIDHPAVNFSGRKVIMHVMAAIGQPGR